MNCSEINYLVASGRECCEGVLSDGGWASGELRGGCPKLACGMKSRPGGRGLEKSHGQDVRPRRAA